MHTPPYHSPCPPPRPNRPGYPRPKRTQPHLGRGLHDGQGGHSEDTVSCAKTSSALGVGDPCVGEGENLGVGADVDAKEKLGAVKVDFANVAGEECVCHFGGNVNDVVGGAVYVTHAG
jgi:hypothetical protein